MYRSFFKILGITIFSVTLFFNCSPKDNLKVLIHLPIQEESIYESVLDRFEKNNQVNVKVEFISASRLQRLKTMPARELEKVDVILAYKHDLMEMGDNFKNLSKYVSNWKPRADFYTPLFEGGLKDHIPEFIPHRISFLTFVYNANKIEERPKSFQQLQKMLHNSKMKFGLNISQPFETMKEVMPVCASRSDTGGCKFKKLASHILQFYSGGKYHAASSNPELLAAQLSGSIDYHFNWSIAVKDKAPTSKIGKRLTISQIPDLYRQPFMCKYLGITKFSDNPKACFELISLLSSEDVQAKLLEKYNKMPVRSSVVQSFPATKFQDTGLGPKTYKNLISAVELAGSDANQIKWFDKLFSKLLSQSASTR